MNLESKTKQRTNASLHFIRPTGSCSLQLPYQIGALRILNTKYQITMMYTMMNTYKTTMLLCVSYASIKKKKDPQQICSKNLEQKGLSETPFTLWLLGTYYVLLSVKGYEVRKSNKSSSCPFLTLSLMKLCSLLLSMFTPD